jgi:hypothetical protein
VIVRVKTRRKSLIVNEIGVSFALCVVQTGRLLVRIVKERGLIAAHTASVVAVRNRGRIGLRVNGVCGSGYWFGGGDSTCSFGPVGDVSDWSRSEHPVPIAGVEKTV